MVVIVFFLFQGENARRQQFSANVPGAFSFAPSESCSQRDIGGMSTAEAEDSSGEIVLRDKGSGEIVLRLQCFAKALEANGKYVVAVQDAVVCGFTKAVMSVFDVDSGCLLHTWVMPCFASGLCWVGRHDPEVIFV